MSVAGSPPQRLWQLPRALARPDGRVGSLRGRLTPATPVPRSTPLGFAILLGTLVTAAALATGCAAPGGADGRRVIVLGIDGMDPGYLQRFIDDGRLPNFARLAAEGSFAPLETSMPPLSPVAWSNFITGMDPGGHGVFDFLHREAATIEMYPPTYRVLPAGRSLRLGSWELPLTGGGVELVRRGRALWEILEDAGVPTTIYRMPMNFPPVEAGGQSLSGMGTPDVLGTSGTYALYTDYPPTNADDLSGGTFHLVEVVDHRVQATLVGPPNTFRRLPSESGAARLSGVEPDYENPDLAIDFEVLVDPEAPAAKIVIQDAEVILNEGEWSDWVGVEFEAVPFVAGVGAAARFYLQEVRPDFRLYVTPLQIDPANPALPLSTPADWAGELSAALDRFYTQELPEDTDAYPDGEFWEQARFVYGEQRRALDHALAGFDEGFLFFYFSSVDQGSHMLHHFGDAEHPAFVEDDLLADGLATLYEEMDEALGRVVEWIGDDERTTLIVMSDHGFTPWYWTVQLNSWLVDQGYVALRDPSRQGQSPLFLNVDWSRTTAYALGLQGLYVNLAGREEQGIVAPGAEYEALLDRLEADLLAMVDERNGRSPVSLAYRSREELRGPYADEAPDIVVGYSRGYRSSWESPLGEFPHEIFGDNDEAWSGDHQNDYRLVPGVLLTNREIALAEPALYDVTVAVLDEFGLPPQPEMIGEDAIGH